MKKAPTTIQMEFFNRMIKMNMTISSTMTMKTMIFHLTTMR